MRPPGTATATTSTTASRTSPRSISPRTPSSSSTTSATRRATRSPATRRRAQATARKRVDNYAAGFLKGGAQAVIADGHGGPEPYIRALFTTHATIEEVWQSAPNFHDHVTPFPSTRTAERDRLHRHRQRDGRLLPLAGRPTGPDHRRGHRRDVRRHRRRPDDARRARQRPGRDQRGAACTATPPSRPTAAASHPRRFPPARGCGRRQRQRPDRRPARRRSGSRASTTRPSTAGCPRPTSSRATARRRRSGRSTRPVAGSRPTATGGSTRRHLTGRFSESVDWRVRILGAATPSSTRRPAPATTSMSRGTGSTARRPPGRRLRLRDLRPGRLGQRADHEDRSRSRSNGPGRARRGHARTLSPDRWFSPNGDGIARHDSLGGHDRRGGLHRLARLRRRRAPRSAGPRSPSSPARARSPGTARTTTGTSSPTGSTTSASRRATPAGTQGTSVTRSVRVDTTLGFVEHLQDAVLPAGRRPLRQDDDARLHADPPRDRDLDHHRRDRRHRGDTLLDAEPTAAGTWTRIYDGRRADGTRLPAGKYTRARDRDRRPDDRRPGRRLRDERVHDQALRHHAEARARRSPSR